MPDQIQWSEIYAELDGNSPIPLQRISTIDTVAVRSDLLLKLDDWMEQCKKANENNKDKRESAKKAKIIRVHADVVQINKSIELDLDSTTLQICARRIEAAPDAAFALKAASGAKGKLLIFCQDVDGALKVKVEYKNSQSTANKEFDLTDRTQFGSIVSAVDGPVLTPMDSFRDSGFEYGDPLRIHAVTILQYGMAAFYSHPEIARSMVSYVQRLSRGSTQAPDLYMQSTAILSALMANAQQVTSVPYLDKSVYEETVKAYVTAAAAYEAQYRRFTDLSASAADRKAAAAIMLAGNHDLLEMNSRLIDQAQENLNQAQKVSNAADAVLRLANIDLQNAATTFETEAKIWTREEIVKAVFEICFAVATVAATVGIMIAGDEAAAPGAVNAAAKAGQAAANAADAAKGTAKLGEMAEKINKVLERIKKSAQTGQRIGTIIAALGKIYATINNISKVVNLPDATLPPTADLSTDPEWDILAIEVESMLQDAVEADIKGAREYVVAAKKVAIYGNAASAAKIPIINFSQQLIQLKLQQLVNANQAARLNDLVEKATLEEKNLEELKQLFFERVLSMRFWVFTAFQQYAWSYRYWALRNSSVKPSLVKPVEQLQEDLATVTREYASALASFNPPPQPFRQSVTILAGEDGVYKGLVEKLRTHKETSIPIALTRPEFAGLGRVRLSTVRVWLLGISASAASEVRLEISTSGYYEDRHNGSGFEFSTEPICYAFRYRGRPGDTEGIVVDGRVEDRSRDLYFQPTPFTQWKLAVPTDTDMEQFQSLSGIQFDFSGSVNAGFAV